jgi:Ankyrin repeats (3 copies)
MGHPMATLWFIQTVGITAPPTSNLYMWLRQIGRAVTPTTLRCWRSSVRSHRVIIATSGNGWTHRVSSWPVRFESGRAATVPTDTFLLRSVATSTPATRRCTSLLPRINEVPPSCSSGKVPMCGLVTEGELNRSTTPPKSPGAEYWDPAAQRDVITYLSEVGADPNAFDNSGVAPLHRAVRTRSSAAVSALIMNGANPKLMNKSGSTPLHLAVQNTGRSDSGSDAAKDEQARIIAVLLEHGASPTDTDAKGKTVAAAASSDWIRDLLGNC